MKKYLSTYLIVLSTFFLVATELMAESPAQKAPVAKPMSKSEIKAGLKSHNHALFIKQHWIRDPYIVLAPDGFYYLTGTTPNPGDPREQTDPYNKGLFKESLVGSTVQIWRSKDLADWKYLGTPYTIEDCFHYQKDTNSASKANRSVDEKLLWAPELHWVDGRWALVHCPGINSSLAFSAGPEMKGPWTHPMGKNFDKKHDPSLFKDDDGKWYGLWENTYIAQISSDFTHFTTEPYFINPSGSRPDPVKSGGMISRIGHEGSTMSKIGGKYVSFGTAWSTDKGRKGSYNLYYCVSDKITGPYGPRQFAGRFLGHGTPFQTRDGKWWCTAFYNGDIPPVSREGIEKQDLSETAQTINQRGTTIVPLDVKVLKNGDIYIRAIDPAYATPGPDENQKFE